MTERDKRRLLVAGIVFLALGVVILVLASIVWVLTRLWLLPALVCVVAGICLWRGAQDITRRGGR